MILFIAQHYNSFFGGGVISHRNLTVCEDVFGKERTKTFFLPAKTSGGIETVKSFANAYLFGLSKEKEDEIIKFLKANSEIKYVFIDNSMLGRLAKKIKSEIPEIYIIVFFHNVEISFFYSFLKSTRRYSHVIGLASILYNEKKAIKYSDSIITLNKRDSIELFKKYGRPADFILPSSIEDKFDEDYLMPFTPDTPLSLLFVGSRFFPNEQGIDWFINTVLPFLGNVHLKIVGKGFEELRGKWSSEKVEIIGSCADISSYYYEADIVIAPIFTGSGMKTKIAEALMYGKTILASSEAFEGYDFNKDIIGKECNSPNSYIDYINNFHNNEKKKFNPDSRLIFTKLYSHDIIAKQFKSFLFN